MTSETQTAPASAGAVSILVRRRGGEVYASVLVDLELADALERFRWYVGRDGYAYRNLSRRTEGRGHEAMHRRIMGLRKGDGLSVDHVNRNRLDNRRANLRIVGSQREQLQNVPARGSGRRGVNPTSPALRKRGAKPWRARLQVNYRQITVGYFDTEDEAAAAVAAARREHMPFATD